MIVIIIIIIITITIVVIRTYWGSLERKHERYKSLFAHPSP